MDLPSQRELLIDDLLDDCWFFENLFTRRSRVLRYCHSDPYPSSLTSPEEMGDSDPRKILEAHTGRCLKRAPSIDRREGGSDMKQVYETIRAQQVDSFLQRKEPVVLPKSGSGSTDLCLIRRPSLPPRIDKREMDYEAKKMVNKLTRQFSEKIRALEPTRPSERFLHKKVALPREKVNNEWKRIASHSGSSKGSVKNSLQRTQTMPSNITREEEEIEDQESDSRMGFLIREALASSHNNAPPKISSSPRQKPPRNLRSQGSTVMVKQGISSSPKTLRKTLSSIETTKEIQRLSHCYDQMVEPRVVIGLATPPRVPKDSRKEMKDQIKFWARAVACNVRQEC